MEPKDENTLRLFDLNKLQRQANMPPQFMWPTMTWSAPRECSTIPHRLEGFIKDEIATAKAVDIVRTACTTMMSTLISFKLRIERSIRSSSCLDKKLGFRQMPSSHSGFSSAHADRFSTNLPWKETFSFSFGTEFRRIIPYRKIFQDGPHCDPNSITILHQDNVGGIEIFIGKMDGGSPRQDTFAIIMGDTFMPEEDAMVKPPEELVVGSTRLTRISAGPI
ncbi:hypothetical protein F3Y22_tig00110388pilonHSYRG00305 [Hibiscus syriacus]|uniref:Isopenicillin N synthase-like Fe(2+) 2OG dioxygenase domain-containing protein n=1 Tax=Hibiscus syriacus TaxID=106335 RepID=A0A6A3AQB7_HIBSY|nr:hypothetical protein F3Y22_tig00110388pilonHSYRG00305 [Hibiscus syriacus]